MQLLEMIDELLLFKTINTFHCPDVILFQTLVPGYNHRLTINPFGNDKLRIEENNRERFELLTVSQHLKRLCWNADMLGMVDSGLDAQFGIINVCIYAGVYSTCLLWLNWKIYEGRLYEKDTIAREHSGVGL